MIGARYGKLYICEDVDTVIVSNVFGLAALEASSSTSTAIRTYIHLESALCRSSHGPMHLSPEIN